MRSEQTQARKMLAPTIIGKTVSIIVTLEMIAALLAVAATVGVQLVGIKTYDVLSGSMEPAIQMGSLVYVKTGIACDSIREGDVIAFDIGHGRTVTHRVMEVDKTTESFTTKGDANTDIDPQEVPFCKVIGKVVGSVPLVGSAASVLTSHKLRFLAAVAAFNLLLCASLHFLAKATDAL